LIENFSSFFLNFYKEVFMIDINRTVKVTPKKAKRKANYVSVHILQKLLGEDKAGQYHLFYGFCIDSQTKYRFRHKFFVKRYGTGPLAKIKAICDCENFTYTWEMALAKVKSSVRYRSNGKAPKLTNPGMVPGICKHLVAVLKATMKVIPTKTGRILLPRNF